MTQKELKTEILTGPLAAELAPFVAESRHNDIKKIFNRKDIPAKRKLSPTGILMYCVGTGIINKIIKAQKVAGESNDTAQELMWILTKLSVDIDIESTLAVSLFGKLLTAGLISQTDVLALQAMADNNEDGTPHLISRAEQLGLSVNNRKIAVALRS